MRIVHYVNQFFAGIGGEEAADTPPGIRPGPVGPARALAALLGAEHEIVATAFCGDDRAASDAGAAEALLELALGYEPDLLLAGPAFTSGRYGLACARLTAACARAGTPALAVMHPDNPGAGEAGDAHVIASGATARQMRAALAGMADAVRALADGREPDGLLRGTGHAPRRNRLSDRCGAQRAVQLLVQRLQTGEVQTEIPLEGFDAVAAGAPLEHPQQALIALLTESALVPAGNPDRLESARATRWLRYPLKGRDGLDAGAFESVHGGFSTTAANADPNRMLPLDVARELERDGAIGALHDHYFTTVGNGTEVAVARRIGVEWAAELRQAGVQAAILTAT